MELDFTKNMFILRCAYENREVAKKHGMYWHPEAKVWYTKSLSVAAKFQRFATPRALDQINKERIVIDPWPLPLPDPPNNRTLMTHQKQAVFFVLERNRSYLGLDPGLGKTAVVATAIRTNFCDLRHDLKAVYITPPFLVRNVIEEFKTWAPEINVSVLTSKTAFLKFQQFQLLILPDTFLASPWVFPKVADFVGGKPSMLVVDEAHRMKSDTAKRTRALFGHGKIKGLISLFSRQVYLSGTPMPNRPIELYTVLSKVAPETIDFQNKYEYGIKYCDAKESAFGWDFSGASNVKDLARKVIYPTGPFMLRMKKELLDLPPKIEQIFLIESNMNSAIKNLDAETFKYLSRGNDFNTVFKISAGKEAANDIHLTTYRRLLGVEKAKASLSLIDFFLEDEGENIIVFAYHKEAIQILKDGLKDHHPLVITGETPMEERQKLVNQFRDDKSKRLFIGNYVAMGVGLNLPKANRVVFVEFSYVPGENDQASDRAHRIGQKNTVLVQYIVYQNSVDEAVINTLLTKRRSIQHI